jgi:hypothetical protein
MPTAVHKVYSYITNQNVESISRAASSVPTEPLSAKPI